MLQWHFVHHKSHTDATVSNLDLLKYSTPTSTTSKLMYAVHEMIPAGGGRVWNVTVGTGGGVQTRELIPVGATDNSTTN